MLRKIIKKRNLAIFFGSIFLLIYVFILFLLKSPVVQTWVSSIATEYLSKELQAPVYIESVDISPFFRVQLNNIFIGDQKKDTIASISQISVFIRNISIANKKIDVGMIELTKPVIKVFKDETGKFRHAFIAEYFAKTDTTQKDSSAWQTTFLGLKINDGKVQYTRYPVPEKKWGMNYCDIAVRDLNLTVDDIKIYNDTIDLHIHKLEAKEQCGLEVKHFLAKVSIFPNAITLTDFEIATPNSEAFLDEYTMQFETFDDFDNFEESIRLIAKIKPSKINMKDISYFSTYLKGINEEAEIEGNIKGTIASLRGKNVKIKIKNNTQLYCDFSISGLPDTDNTFWHFDFKKLHTQMDELTTIPIPPFNEYHRLQLPQVVKKFGTVNYVGKFTGLLTDFVAYGNWTTSVGNLKSDISLKGIEGSDRINFKGKIASSSIQAGMIAGLTQDIGNASFSLTADGSAWENGKLNVDLAGNIHSLEFKKYNYNNIKVNGTLTESMFDGELHISDPNIGLDFLGSVDFTEKIPSYHFSAEVQKANVTKLNIVGVDSVSQLSLSMDANLTGNNIDNLNGKIELSQVSIKTSRNTINSKNVIINAIQDDVNKEISLHSDLLDVGISGNFSFTNITDAFIYLTEGYYPSLFNFTIDEKVIKKIESSAYFIDFDIYTGKMNALLDEIMPGLRIAENSKITGNIDFSNKIFDFESTIPTSVFNDYYINSIKTSGKGNNGILTLNTTANKLTDKEESFKLENLFVNINGKIDTAFAQLGFKNIDTTLYEADISGMLRLVNNPETKLPIFIFETAPSYFVITDTMWYINEGVISYIDSVFTIDKLVINHNDQYIYSNGTIGKWDEKLEVILSEFNLNNINLFLPKSYNLKGKVNGNAEVNGLLSSMKINSNLDIDNLVFNNEELGKMTSKVLYNSDKKQLELDGSLFRGVIKTLNYNGYISNNGDLDVKLDFNKVRLKLFEPFLKGILSEVRGDLSGKLTVSGNLDKPKLIGLINIQKATFLVDYLQTRYNFTHDILITNNSFECKDLKLFDSNGNIAVVQGKINHNNFEKITILSQVKPEKFLFLNTLEKDNELFYGKAQASGLIDVTGTFDNIFLNINVKTEKGTQFFIPLTSGSEVSTNDFITFINNNDNLLLKKEETAKVTGLNMDFNLEVTPDAEVQIIFDNKVGDVIKGVGNGNIKMNINTKGNFSLFGDFIIDKGDYLFTLQNVINKKFEIEKGGSIRWSGDPYEAIVDMKAIYRLKTGISEITLDTTQKNRVPVECQLSLKNNLMQPDMDFAIHLPGSDTKAQGIINNLPKEELNRQIIFLLAMNKFVTPESMMGGIQTANTKSSGNSALGVTSSELLSNQLSHWLSQISKDFDVGVNYRPGDELTTDELEVALSTQILNDRVILNGNLGVGGQQQNSNTNSNSQFLGDFEVEVKVNKSGKLRVKGFARSNESILYDTSPYRQGIGLFYREDFDSFPKLLKAYMDAIFRRKEKSSQPTKN